MRRPGIQMTLGLERLRKWSLRDFECPGEHRGITNVLEMNDSLIPNRHDVDFVGGFAAESHSREHDGALGRDLPVLHWLDSKAALE